MYNLSVRIELNDNDIWDYCIIQDLDLDAEILLEGTAVTSDEATAECLAFLREHWNVTE